MSHMIIFTYEVLKHDTHSQYKDQNNRHHNVPSTARHPNPTIRVSTMGPIRASIIGLSRQAISHPGQQKILARGENERKRRTHALQQLARL